MTDQFLGEIRIFGGNFAPTGWANCNGQLLPISQNTALFSLLGTQFGGDGRSTFALPNLQGNAPMSQGSGPGLSQRFVGETGGSPSVTLLTTEMPAHSHALQAHGADFGDVNAPSGAVILARSQGAAIYGSPDVATVAAASGAVGQAGGSQPHNNMPPYLTLTFIIALQGVYPARG